MTKVNTGNWADVPAYTGGGASEKLELGGHYLQILKAEIIQGNARATGQPYQMIKISFDTDKNDAQPGFFRKKFEAGKQYGRDQWPNAGTGVVSIPFASETDKRAIGRWNGFVETINQSNSQGGRTYHWDFDTDSLKGKRIGGVFRDEEFLSNKGEILVTQKLAWFCEISAVEDASIPDTKTLSGQTQAPSRPQTTQPDLGWGSQQTTNSDLDLPFDL